MNNINVNDYVFWMDDRDFVWQVESIEGVMAAIREVMGGDTVLREWADVRELRVLTRKELDWFFEDDDDY